MKNKQHFHLTRVLLGTAAILASPVFVSTSYASPCKHVPQCEKQEKSAKSYKGLQTRGWAYHCKGTHPYYWNNDQVLGFGNNFSFNNKCFTVTENPFSEGAHKFDATITNWCLKTEKIKVTLGCSRVPQSGPSCTLEDKVVKDPKCPTVKGSSRNFCNSGRVPVCIQTWEEQCSDNTQYYCTDDQTVVWCTPCK